MFNYTVCTMRSPEVICLSNIRYTCYMKYERGYKANWELKANPTLTSRKKDFVGVLSTGERTKDHGQDSIDYHTRIAGAGSVRRVLKRTHLYC